MSRVMEHVKYALGFLLFWVVVITIGCAVLLSYTGGDPSGAIIVGPIFGFIAWVASCASAVGDMSGYESNSSERSVEEILRDLPKSSSSSSTYKSKAGYTHDGRHRLPPPYHMQRKPPLLH